jgi:hypothetical protein
LGNEDLKQGAVKEVIAGGTSQGFSACKTNLSKSLVVAFRRLKLNSYTEC